MRTLLALALILTSLASYAAGGYGRGTFQFSDKDIAYVRVSAKDINETMDLLTVQIRCVDRRAQKNAVVPQWESVEGVNELPICLNRPRTNDFDSVNKVLTVHYSLSVPQPSGQEKCADHKKAEIDLRAFCDAWQH